MTNTTDKRRRLRSVRSMVARGFSAQRIRSGLLDTATSGFWTPAAMSSKRAFSGGSDGLILSLLVRIRHKVVWLWSRSAVATAVHS